MKEKRRRLLEDFNESVMEADGLGRQLKDEKHETDFVREVGQKEYRLLEALYADLQQEVLLKEMITEDHISLILREQERISKLLE